MFTSAFCVLGLLGLSSVGIAAPSPDTDLTLALYRQFHQLGPQAFQTMAQEHGWGVPSWADTTMKPAAKPFSDKQVRNAYAGNPQSLETDNFVVWWGTTGGVIEADIAALGVELEHIWDVQTRQMALPGPLYSDSYKFNVYIGDTGDGVPSAEGAAGYFWYDAENYPMMVLSSEIIDWTDSAKLTAAHEFFHAVQAAIDTYRYSEAAMWWHEATANWILEEVYPENMGYSNTLYSVFLRPEIALQHWGDYATEGIEADHHYGASIFASYLSEYHGGSETIIRSFTEAPVNGDPLQVIDTLLRESGTNLIDMHLDYACRNITWDYTYGASYKASVDDYTGGGESHRVSGTATVSSDWQGPGDWPPHTYGVNNWQLDSLPEVYTITFEGDAGIDWRVGVSMRDANGTQQEWMTMDGANGQLVVSGAGADVEQWLVVAAVDDENDDGEFHGYRFRIMEGEPAADDGGDIEAPKAGGCNTSPWQPGNLGYGLLLMLGVLLQRRWLGGGTRRTQGTHLGY